MSMEIPWGKRLECVRAINCQARTGVGEEEVSYSKTRGVV